MHYAANCRYGEKNPRTRRFKGFLGYSNVKNGTIDKQTISDLHKRSYKDLKRKMKYFFLAHQVLADPTAIEFNKLNCDILIYKDFFGKRIHIGLKTTRNKAVPITFLVEDLTDLTFTQEPQSITVHKVLKRNKLKISKALLDKLKGRS
ncbi:hypothetical protein D8M03_16100 [Lysinibacillus endophyticus]|uniref:Uncharacterized protein n=1 Tax=Ureibacillus endophyticus TaxID=1978490 RepID=A0A494YTX2_9BACL|nr:hypothetical protein D8M03_16100 [Lysinibacillus endophyticus]